ncbi:MAG TPA: hypothetical protein VK530_10510 [Candidatus Acidoferrum sp.]|nr:hypothetical protein [Candidatus Acidoferrum sp.]
MKVWKVILATVVIFLAGVVTGTFIARNPSPVHSPQPPTGTPVSPPNPMIVQERFLSRMKQELNLTPEQIGRLEKIFAESRERMKILMDIIEPEWRGELRDVREKIIVELRPDQRDKFEQMLKHPRGRGDGDGKKKGEKRVTNTEPASTAPTL